MSDLERRAIPRSSYRAARRDAPVNCPSCGREVQRRARHQRFCSRRCRQKANYGEVALGWPPPVKIGRRNFRNRHGIETFKKNLIAAALAERESKLAAA